MALPLFTSPTLQPGDGAGKKADLQRATALNRETAGQVRSLVS